MWKKVICLAVLGTGMLFGANAQAAEVVVGGKNFTEQLLMSEMTCRLLNDNGVKAKKVDGMGTTVLRRALENAQVDVYWEYTGTSLVTFNKVQEKLSAEETYNRVKELDGKQGIVWLNPSKANNTYALAVRSADDKGLSTLTDLAKAYNGKQSAKMGVNAEFPKRPDGLPGLEDTYGFKAGRANLVPMESGLIYQALRDGQIDVGLIFATDGRVAAFNFKVLKDDKGYFPDYAMVPNVRKAVLDANPKVGDLLNKLSAKLDDATMQGLNAKVDVDKVSIEKVAEDFLKSAGLI